MTSELCGCINTIDVLLLIGDPVGGRGAAYFLGEGHAGAEGIVPWLGFLVGDGFLVCSKVSSFIVGCHLLVSTCDFCARF